MNPTCWLTILLFTSAALAAPPPGTTRNFVACPIVRDTQTVPCWLAEYEGELYYLGIQSDADAEWRPPLLGHKVLVEGVVAEAYRICGGVVLRPLHTSAFVEADASCSSQVLPAEDRFTVPFARRGAGPASGAPVKKTEPGDVGSFVITYDFDWPWVAGASTQELERAIKKFRRLSPKRIDIVAYRGATLLSNGTILAEQGGIAETRANRLAELMEAAGVDPSSLHLEWRDDPATADGMADYDSRRATIEIKAVP